MSLIIIQIFEKHLGNRKHFQRKYTRDLREKKCSSKEDRQESKVEMQGLQGLGDLEQHKIF